MTLAIAIISALLRAVLVGITVFMLTHPDLRDVLNRRERIGGGITGGCGFLTIPVILDVQSAGTPFDVIAGLAMSIGVILFLWGFLDRKLGHARRNRAAVEQATQHFARKGS